MYLLFIITISCLIGLHIFSFIRYRKKEKERLEFFTKYYREELRATEQSKRATEINMALLEREQKLKTLEKEIADKSNFKAQLDEWASIDLAAYKTQKMTDALAEVQRSLEEWAKSAQEAANYAAEIDQEAKNKETQKLQLQLDKLKEEVDKYESYVNTIHIEQLQARKIAEDIEFYSLQLEPTWRADLEILQSIKSKLNKIDIFDKVIYDNYVKKPADEMIKRILQGRAPCGIYKITRLKTKEIYIGQSTDIKARWTQHIKSVYHCGTISHSLLHTTMEKDGIWNFTWELLEEVPKDKLREREKFWIDFFDSKKYGLNEKVG